MGSRSTRRRIVHVPEVIKKYKIKQNKETEAIRQRRPGRAAVAGRTSTALTGVRVHGEVGLALQDAVHHLGAVPVGGVVRVQGRHLDDRGAWGGGREDS